MVVVIGSGRGDGFLFFLLLFFPLDPFKFLPNHGP